MRPKLFISFSKPLENSTVKLACEVGGSWWTSPSPNPFCSPLPSGPPDSRHARRLAVKGVVLGRQMLAAAAHRRDRLAATSPRFASLQPEETLRGPKTYVYRAEVRAGVYGHRLEKGDVDLHPAESNKE